jgi:hypothetical protein
MAVFRGAEHVCTISIFYKINHILYGFSISTADHDYAWFLLYLNYYMGFYL